MLFNYAWSLKELPTIDPEVGWSMFGINATNLKYEYEKHTAFKDQAMENLEDASNANKKNIKAVQWSNFMKICVKKQNAETGIYL